MNYEIDINDIKSKIIIDPIGCLEFLKEKNIKYYGDDIFLLLSRINHIEKSFENGIIDFNEYTINRNRIIASAINILNKIYENIDKIDFKIDQNLYIEIRKSVIDCSMRMSNIMLDISNYKKNKINKKSILGYTVLVENYLNYYDLACSMYLNKTISREQFERDYKNEIFAIFEKGELIVKKYFSGVDIHFESLITVHELLKEKERKL